MMSGAVGCSQDHSPLLGLQLYQDPPGITTGHHHRPAHHPKTYQQNILHLSSFFFFFFFQTGFLKIRYTNKGKKKKKEKEMTPSALTEPLCKQTMQGWH